MARNTRERFKKNKLKRYLKMVEASLYYYGSSAIGGTKARGLDGVQEMIVSEKEAARTLEKLIAHLRTAQYRYYYVIYVFHVSPDGNYYDAYYGETDAVSTAEFDLRIKTLIEGYIGEAEPTVTGYGWVGTISASIDLESKDLPSLFGADDQVSGVYSKKVWEKTQEIFNLRKCIGGEL